ncbi:type VII secretion system-associated protein [Streptomyces sp. NPDC020845]|uniref:type VII secretion system-associated protein n=1 Tax=Streptomyces sp. NPDC020845 TaxID=3365096 RepID=UPI0037BBDEA8
MAEPIQLDKAWMEHFINVDVHDFQAELKKILKDKGDIPALGSLKSENPHDWKGADIPSGTKLPLTIGAMTEEEELTNGSHIHKTLKQLIDQILGMIEDQQKLFDDIEDNLRETVNTLLKTQGDNLGKIDGEKILDPLEDVDDDLASEGSGSGGGDGKDDKK